MNKKGYSLVEYVLLGLVPYSKPNLKLVFAPYKFFRELEKLSQAKRSTLQSTLARAQKQGLIKRKHGVPVLTKQGFERIRPYTAKTLKRDVKLMVIFDIPEKRAYHRRQFRRYLQQLGFKQTQKSVWTTGYDYQTELLEVVTELRLGQFVQLFECARILP